jgi:pimeloyl-ACP methyl ester carboxylesterase
MAVQQSTVQVGDIRLNVAQCGTGRPLLLVHGFPLDHQMWAGQLSGPVGSHRLIAPDLRGFGKSSVTMGAVTMEQYADDLALLLDTLGVGEPVTFCGLSMGGYIAWQFAQKYRQRLARLVLCDTRSVADSQEAAEGRQKTADKALQEGPEFLADSMLPKLFAPSSHAYVASTVAQTRQIILQTPREGIAAALRGMAVRPDVTALLPTLDVPTLVICGEHDAIAPPAEMRQIALAIPNATYVEIPAAGHMAPLEQPAAVNAALLHFLP